MLRGKDIGLDLGYQLTGEALCRQTLAGEIGTCPLVVVSRRIVDDIMKEDRQLDCRSIGDAMTILIQQPQERRDVLDIVIVAEWFAVRSKQVIHDALSCGFRTRVPPHQIAPPVR